MWVLTGADSSRPPTIWLSFCSYKIRTRPPLRNHLPASDEQGRTAHGKSLGWAAFQVLQTGWAEKVVVRGKTSVGPWRTTLLPSMPAWHLPGWAAGGSAPARSSKPMTSGVLVLLPRRPPSGGCSRTGRTVRDLSLIHISEPT